MSGCVFEVGAVRCVVRIMYLVTSNVRQEPGVKYVCIVKWRSIHAWNAVENIYWHGNDHR